MKFASFYTHHFLETFLAFIVRIISKDLLLVVDDDFLCHLMPLKKHY